MTRFLALALYLGTLIAVVYGWWPHVHKVAYVEGQTVYAGWEALWQMFPLLALMVLTVGLGLTAVLMASAIWINNAEVAETRANDREKERAIEKRAAEIMARAREQVAQAESQEARYKQAAEKALADERAATARAKKAREESESAHRNVREQLKRLRQQNAKLNEH